MSLMNLAASAPSIYLWSNEMLRYIILRIAISPSTTSGRSLIACSPTISTQRPDVGDRAAAASDLVEGQLARAGTLGLVCDFFRKLDQVFDIGIPNHGYDQALRRVHRNADVVILLEQDLLPCFIDRSVEDRVLLEGCDQCLDEEGQQRQADARSPALTAGSGPRDR